MQALFARLDGESRSGSSDHDGAESSVKSSDSSSADSDSSPSNRHQSRLNMRRLQTEKARQAAYRQRCLNIAQQSLPTLAYSETPRLLCAEMQSSCFAKSTDTVKHACVNRHWLQRGLLAYLKATFTSLKDLLCTKCVSQGHVIAFNVMDDCSIRLANAKLNSSSVHTVCNNYQRLLLRSDENRATTLRVHQPLMTMPSGSAIDLHTSWSSWLLLSAFGVGARLISFGIADSDIKCKLQCQVLMSDGLKTNNAVFNFEVRETLRPCMYVKQDTQEVNMWSVHVFFNFVYIHFTIVLQRRKGNTSDLLVHFHHHCHLHIASLIQRPLVLAVQGFWSNLVRFAHLARLFSWRRRFLQCLAQVVAESYLFVPVAELPSECAQFQKSLSQILSNTVSADTSHKTKTRQKLLDMDNSDPSGTVIAHYCTPSCSHCNGEHAKSDMVQAYVQEFATFFDVPLLARWKHYGPAIDYVRKGLCLHQVLPRTILRMGRRSQGGDIAGVDSLLTGAKQESREKDLEDLLECNESLANENGKRQQKLVDFFSQSDISQQSVVLDALIKPLDKLLDARFTRTNRLHRLSHCLNFFPGVDNFRN